ncbi:MAG: HIT family protein [Verrucomicrobia subdivision 3 bacterium]|nr:HIT family protein [Limisphaerales bacterium]
MFTLHSQLQADCHTLGRLPSGPLLLHRNAAVTWFILVPETDVVDLFDLPEAQHTQAMADCRTISAYLKTERQVPKINFGAIGNLVPQLHLHIVGRTPEDACWPQPVWGNLPEGPAYTESELETLRTQLIEHSGLQPEA